MLIKDLNHVTIANKVKGMEGPLRASIIRCTLLNLIAQVVICNKHVSNDGCIQI
ncbi:hypothetical protein HanPI659440_Chr16g0651311 [Helianthus annuus]|nr:hypothetical protein HanIR_Chr16g0832241 [Helianthus annuus]KAJ0682792.1 hypothetical protein HanPI659440_Chr16g0651311 [Helianthus annuus]